tara:strand:- start:7604 stop:9481 length:1878 start_codon:yes stop_codon:yes gene_type:complete
MYKTITDPYNNKAYSIDSPGGMNLLRKYIQFINPIGGSNMRAPPKLKPSDAVSPVTLANNRHCIDTTKGIVASGYECQNKFKNIHQDCRDITTLYNDLNSDMLIISKQLHNKQIIINEWETKFVEIKEKYDALKVSDTKVQKKLHSSERATKRANKRVKSERKKAKDAQNLAAKDHKEALAAHKDAELAHKEAIAANLKSATDETAKNLAEAASKIAIAREKLEKQEVYKAHHDANVALLIAQHATEDKESAQNQKKIAEAKEARALAQVAVTKHKIRQAKEDAEKAHAATKAALEAAKVSNDKTKLAEASAKEARARSASDHLDAIESAHQAALQLNLAEEAHKKATTAENKAAVSEARAASANSARLLAVADSQQQHALAQDALLTAQQALAKEESAENKAFVAKHEAEVAHHNEQEEHARADMLASMAKADLDIAQTALNIADAALKNEATAINAARHAKAQSDAAEKEKKKAEAAANLSISNGLVMKRKLERLAGPLGDLDQLKDSFISMLKNRNLIETMTGYKLGLNVPNSSHGIQDDVYYITLNDQNLEVKHLSFGNYRKYIALVVDINGKHQIMLYDSSQYHPMISGYGQELGIPIMSEFALSDIIADTLSRITYVTF